MFVFTQHNPHETMMASSSTHLIPFLPGMPSGPGRTLATGWLILALSSLAGSGLVVILILLARTPVLYDLMPWTGSFKTALVIHVDLSTLVWFLSFGGLLTVILLPTRERHGQLYLTLAAVGACLLAFSPFLGKDAPFLSNYVPVLENAAFFLGLGLFAAGFGLAALEGLWHRVPPGQSEGMRALGFGARTALILALASAALLAWSHATLPPELQAVNRYHYEILFWSAGHLLQFTHIQFLMLAWLWLATVTVGGIRLKSGTWILFLLGLGILPVLAAPVIHLVFEIDSARFRMAFTTLMTYGGLILLPAGALVAWSLVVRPKPRPRPPPPEGVALQLSLFLAAVGGILGFMIQEVNVTIPAHYHGSIVSITLAYMGLTYHLLPRLGFRAILPSWANRQLWLYGAGSLLHILGLAWSGGHGVQRKTAGVAQGLETFALKLPMWIMGAGGLLAVVGGILFLVLTFRALISKATPHPPPSTP